MSKSRWSKMTDADKKAYYAARKARNAAKAKDIAKAVKNAPKGADHVATPHGAVPVPEKKATAKKCGKACSCKKDPNGSPEERLLAAIFGKDASKIMCGGVSVSELKAAFSLVRAHEEYCAVDRACRKIGNALLDLLRVFRPDMEKIVIEHKDAPAPVPAKKVPAKK